VTADPDVPPTAGVSRELVLALHAAERLAGDREYPCVCEHADIGIGLMKVSEHPECPRCTETGYALWAEVNGTDAEKLAARAYLDELLGREVPRAGDGLCYCLPGANPHPYHGTPRP
jgi:hypothetical protein